MADPRPRHPTVADLGEDRLITQLTRGFPLTPDVRVGVGDDCAVIGAPRAARWRLLKTDAVIESVHFVPGENLARVGWKALCRAISDIAAMGGLPEHALITVALPPAIEVARVKELYAGLRKAARKFGVAMVGGETSRSPGPLFVSIALTGSVERARCILRSGAQAGDALCVTGRLGGSRAGKHLDFMPRVAEARWLTAHFKVHAMMDISDGLGRDAHRLAAASRCAVELWRQKLPRNERCSVEEALSDGEDYELLFAISSRDIKRLDHGWKQAFPKLPLTQIGVFSNGPRRGDLKQMGYDHFAQS